MKTNEIPQANQLDNVHIISLLDRLEAAKKVLEKSEDIESTIEKLNNLEYFLRRFGTLKDLATHMLFIERKMYILKEYLTVTRIGLFFVRLERICITRFISLSRPTTGSSFPSL